MNYGFFFDYNNETIRLPVNPEKFSIGIEQEGTKKTVVGLGAINIIGNVKLQEIEFEAEFPCQQQSYGTTKNQFKGPYFYLEKFKKYMVEKKPVRFVLTRNYEEAKDLKNVSMLVTISSMDIDEEALEEGDLKITFNLLEYSATDIEAFLAEPWKFDTSKTVNVVIKKKIHVIKENNPPRPVSTPVAIQTRTYTVKKGDCLWNIAKKYYGNGNQYMKIYNANKDKIKKPSLIYPNQVLVIP
mgnify:CR=1 FL=1